MLFSFQKDQKYYNLHVQPNLFGGSSIICSWGSNISRRNGNKIIVCSDDAERKQVIEKITKRRYQRGYKDVS